MGRGKSQPTDPPSRPSTTTSGPTTAWICAPSVTAPLATPISTWTIMPRISVPDSDPGAAANHSVGATQYQTPAPPTWDKQYALSVLCELRLRNTHCHYFVSSA
eukprot:3631751-Rhodomonas_salina.1